MKYYIGLDLGTNSVGWAVTDTEYKILRKKGKDLWGIREFEEAKTSAARRTNRISRRRLEREKARIGLLKAMFADEIEKIDPNFFERLENSRYISEDKAENVQGINGIFNDADYRDADYFREYPTIFHLRKELITNTESHDVRLVFLALLNMFKHRGHFLDSSLNDDDSETNFDDIYESITETMGETYEIFLKTGCGNQLKDILADNSISRTVKMEKISSLWGITKKDKKEYECAKLICGLKANLRVIFDTIESEEKFEICFSDSGYEEKISELNDKMGDEIFDTVSNFKQAYDAGRLANILNGEEYLSYSRVASYNKHKSDLEILKKIYRKYADKATYVKMFKSSENGSYSAYVNSVNSGKKIRKNMNERKADCLYASIKKDIKNELQNSDKDVAYIYREMQNQTFLPKQLTADNGVIPNQVHLKEMKRILKNAEAYLPFLSQKDDAGLTTSEKIIALFKYQIPYYIGPTSEKSARDGGNGWVVRKQPGPVLPWNFEERIDVGATAKVFIERMLRDCTYIRGEKAMPKSSLDYEKYCVLNEINNIRIDGERIDVELKQAIYNDLFLNGKKVTRNKLEKYLHGKGIDPISVSGIDKEISNYLASYGKFNSIFDDDLKLDKYRTIAEDIIYLATVFGDSKKMLKEQISIKYADVLSTEQIKKIVGFKFKDWGRFSRAFLELNACDKSTGEETSIIRALWETQYNLMELINSDEFTFKDELESLKKETLSGLTEMTFDDLNEYYFSNPVKRMIWQTVLVIRDIKKVMGEEPDRIFIEMTREDQEKGDKGRKDSRKKTLLSLYQNIKDENHNWTKEIENADASGILRSKKIFLYYTQMGRCMYTGEPIDFENLLNANSNYDIDHIYPRHFVKDDNIGNNMVLVKKEYNNNVKGDRYPIPATIRSNPEIQALWRSLRNNHLITEEKYNRLTNGNSFTDEQRADFIARQLVETSQGMKGIADILKQVLPKTTIVYSKGSNVSEFRKKYEFAKSRIVNEFHHAQDAYLNIVVGNVYYTKFTQNPINFIKGEFNRDRYANNYNLNNMYEKDVTRNDYCAWKGAANGNPGTIKIVREMMSKNTPLMTRLSYEETGELFNLTVYGKNTAKPGNYVPTQKGLDVTKYGGYTSLKPAYFIFVEHGPDKKRKKTFDVIHTYYASSIKTDEDLINHCRNVLGLENPRVITAKIKKYSLIKMDGYYLYITGMDSAKKVELHSAVNLCISAKDVGYIHDLEVSCENGRLKDTITKEKNVSLYEVLKEKHLKTIYKCNPKHIGEMLEKGEEKFIGMTEQEQCETLVKILKVSGIETQNVDLKEIGGPSDTGRIRISGNMTDKKELLLINQSVTGLYSTVTDLLSS